MAFYPDIFARDPRRKFLTPPIVDDEEQNMPLLRQKANALEPPPEVFPSMGVGAPAEDYPAISSSRIKQGAIDSPVDSGIARRLSVPEEMPVPVSAGARLSPPDTSSWNQLSGYQPPPPDAIQSPMDAGPRPPVTSKVSAGLTAPPDYPEISMDRMSNPAELNAPLPRNAYSQYEKAGPRMQQYEKLAAQGEEKHRGGFWSRMKDFGLGYLETGNAVEAGRELANPQRRHDRLYNEELNRAANQAQAENILRHQRMGQLDDYGAATGEIAGLPGVPNERTKERNVIADQNRIKQEELNADRGRRFEETKRMNSARIGRYAQLDTRERKRQVAADYKSGMFGDDPEALQWAARELGIPFQLQPMFMRGMMRDDFDAEGNMIEVNRQTGEATNTGVKSGTFMQRGERIHQGAARMTLEAYAKGAPMTAEARAMLKAAGVANADQLPDTYDPNKYFYNPQTGEINAIGSRTGAPKGMTKVTPSPKKGKGKLSWLEEPGEGGQAAAPQQEYTVKASELPAKLEQWNKAHPNQQFDMNALRKELANRKYTVLENQ